MLEAQNNRQNGKKQRENHARNGERNGKLVAVVALRNFRLHRGVPLVQVGRAAQLGTAALLLLLVGMATWRTVSLVWVVRHGRDVVVGSVLEKWKFQH